jgi:hypothetical protein
MFYISDDDWDRSTDFAKPWRISQDVFGTRYGRRSKAIVDANGKIIILIDPSENEFEPACDDAAAAEIVRIANT